MHSAIICLSFDEKIYDKDEYIISPIDDERCPQVIDYIGDEYGNSDRKRVFEILNEVIGVSVQGTINRPTLTMDIEKYKLEYIKTIKANLGLFTEDTDKFFRFKAFVADGGFEYWFYVDGEWLRLPEVIHYFGDKTLYIGEIYDYHF